MVALDRQIFADCDPPPWESVTWWVVCDGRNVVGYAGASLMDRGKTLQLVRVGLAPEARGKGLQRRLIAARQRWGRRARARRSIAYTATWNTGSSNNLIRMGYELFRPRARKCGFGADKENFIYFHRRL
jgi:GNAT superfamily N-acetyltransferase